MRVSKERRDHRTSSRPPTSLEYSNRCHDIHSVESNGATKRGVERRSNWVEENSHASSKAILFWLLASGAYFHCTSCKSASTFC